MTGAHRPTKPIGPARVTAAAESSTASTMTVSRVRRTSRPSTVAVSSPRARMSRRRPEQHEHDGGADDHRRELGQRGQVALHQRAVPPGEQADGGLLNRSSSRVRHRPERQRGRRAGEDQPGGAGLPTGGHRQHQAGGGQPADEGEAAGGQRGQRDAERGDRDDRQVGARVDSEGVGGGERVAGDRLQRRPGEAERARRWRARRAAGAAGTRSGRGPPRRRCRSRAAAGRGRRRSRCPG